MQTFPGWLASASEAFYNLPWRYQQFLGANQPAHRQADEDGIKKTRKGANDDVLSLFTIFTILEFAKT